MWSCVRPSFNNSEDQLVSTADVSVWCLPIACEWSRATFAARATTTPTMYMCPKHDDFLFYARIVRATPKRNFRHVDTKIFRRKMFTGSSILQRANSKCLWGSHFYFPYVPRSIIYYIK